MPMSRGQKAVIAAAVATAMAGAVVLIVLSREELREEPGRSAENPPASSFRLKRDAYPELPAPAEAREFRWNFSTDTAYAYDYLQKVNMHSEMGRSGGSAVQKMRGTGKMLVKSQGDGTARMVIQDLEVQMEMAGSEPQFMPAQVIVVPGVREDGSVEGSLNQQQMIVELLFPLPNKPLTAGRSDSIRASMPFNAMGSLLEVTGKSVVTLAGYFDVDGRKCARFDVDTEITDVEIPPEMEGEYSATLKGRSVHYFDIEERAFVSGRLAFLMTLHITTEVPRSVQEMGGDVPSDITIKMESDNYVEVSRIGTGQE